MAWRCCSRVSARRPDLPGIQRPEATRRGLRSIDMVTRPLPSLESTVEEARTIAHLFPQSRVFLGAEAAEGAVKAAQAPRLLHLATHGFFLPEQRGRACEGP